MFEVVVMLACRRADPEGPRGAGSTLRLPYTQEGVSYTYRFDDPATEPPAAIGELWLYVRFFRRRGAAFVTRGFGLQVLALNADGTTSHVPYPDGSTADDPFDLGRVPFPAGQPVVNWTFAVRDLILPRRGRYEFRLLARRRRPSWKGEWSHVGSHYILVE